MRCAHAGRTRKLGIFSIAALILFGTAVLLPAQENLGRGRISGTVVDEAGAPLEGALVIAQSLQSTAKLDGKTDKKGHFAIAGLGSGRWQVTASKEGYGTSSQEMNVSQLKSNPPLVLTIQKSSGLAALKSDTAQLELFDQGNTLLKEGKPDEAIKLFEDFLVKYPEIYQARLNIASAYLQKGDLEAAEARFRDVLEKIIAAHGDYAKDKATAVRAFSGLGEIGLKKNDFEAARKAFSEALAVSQEDEAAAYNVGEIFFSNQKIDEAIQYFELAIKIRPGWSKPYSKLGFVYLNKGEFDKALEFFNKFVTMDPQNPEVPQVRNVIATIEKMKK